MGAKHHEACRGCRRERVLEIEVSEEPASFIFSTQEIPSIRERMLQLDPRAQLIPHPP
jgi:hypothetical protein